MKRITALTGIVVALAVAAAPTAAQAAPASEVCQTVQQILFFRIGC